MGTSTGRSGGTGGGWTTYKRNAALFAKYGGADRAGKALAGFVAAMGGAAAAVVAAAPGAQTGQSLAAFLVLSDGLGGVNGGLRSVGLGRLVGSDRVAVLAALVDEFSGTGSDLEAQAARGALIDVLDDLLPEEIGSDLADVRLEEADIIDALCRYLAALVYNRAIPIISQSLDRLEDPALATRRDRELRQYITALVQHRVVGLSPMDVDWKGDEGRALFDGILRALYDQVE